MVKPEIKRVLRLQLSLMLAAVGVGALYGGGSAQIPVSILIGGLIVLIPALVYTRIAFARRHVSPAVLMQAHYKAEAVKFVLTLLMFGAVIVFFKDVSVAALFIGYLVTVAGYWFGLLIKN